MIKASELAACATLVGGLLYVAYRTYRSASDAVSTAVNDVVAGDSQAAEAVSTAVGDEYCSLNPGDTAHCASKTPAVHPGLNADGSSTYRDDR